MIPVLSFLVLGLAVLTHEMEEEAPQSPCPDVFMYELPVETPGTWYGVINLKTDVALASIQLNIVLDGKADLLGNWIGDVKTKDNIDFTIENNTLQIQPGHVESVRFFVRHQVLRPAPKPISIKLNYRELCDIKSQITTIRLPVVDDDEDEDDEEEESDDDFNGGPFIPAGSGEVCGKVVNPIALAVGGKPTLEGQWPWQIALYKYSKKSGRSSYICGGTLISQQHVITAAHCVTSQKTHKVVQPYRRTVHLGKHNLRTSTHGTAVMFVKKIIRHPDYDVTSSHSNDLAILELQEAVQFSNHIRTACLWPEDKTDLTYVIGNDIVGSVVGWGADATGTLTEELMLVEMPVVDQLTCARSDVNTGFYVKFTSAYTYCAGYKNGTSVCNGDSGGGMVFKMGENQDTWYLRGLVSLSPAIGPGDKRCDPYQYIIFTDLAKFLPWIKTNIGL